MFHKDLVWLGSCKKNNKFRCLLSAREVYWAVVKLTILKENLTQWSKFADLVHLFICNREIQLVAGYHYHNRTTVCNIS